MTPGDDIKAFLVAFEREAAREKWPQDRWAGLLAPFLSGDVQSLLRLSMAEDYTSLKKEILTQARVTSAVRAQQLFDLLHLGK